MFIPDYVRNETTYFSIKNMFAEYDDLENQYFLDLMFDSNMDSYIEYINDMNYIC